ncbi:DUF2489 domain-containing protein [Neptunomonas qingdaonensis]|uniref:DUF2489 domain-containing protein n=1 Tax=Neptunomonas qingdaonensis TaxID=1045558 RepID=A0A1I2VBT4_9GAMM|nr:DUF2489 domain-containing protein [Neptunomonas qingdaonensis]SFG84866.1 Protein of unknown function [Neptunomonas qingdaonensis]
MSESTVFVLIGLGVLIIFFLSFFIYKKYISLVNIKRQKEEQAERLRAAQEEKYKHIIDSLKILSQALMTEQVGVVEGAIRIKVLIDHHDPDLHKNQSYAVFSDIFAETEHIPFLKAWKELDKRSKRKYELFMSDIEMKRGEEVKAAAVKLNAELSRTLH